MAFHKAQVAGEIHQIHNWVVANAAARAALVLVAADIGKSCLQSDTGDIYLLKNNTGPIWTNLTAGAGADLLSILTSPEVSVTTTAALSFGVSHVCSGTTADYTVTLPAVAGNAGKFVLVRMAQGLTRLVTVKGNASENIDGQNTRVMWAGESAHLMCDGTAWVKVGGRSKPMSAYIYRSALFSSFVLNSWTRVPLNVLGRDNTSALAVPMADTSNGVIFTRRPGLHLVNASMNLSGVTAGYFTGAGMHYATGAIDSVAMALSTNPYGWLGQSGASAGPLASRSAGNGSAIINAVAGAHCKMMGYSSQAASYSTTNDPTDMPYLAVTEYLEW